MTFSLVSIGNALLPTTITLNHLHHHRHRRRSSVVGRRRRNKQQQQSTPSAFPAIFILSDSAGKTRPAKIQILPTRGSSELTAVRCEFGQALIWRVERASKEGGGDCMLLCILDGMVDVKLSARR